MRRSLNRCLKVSPSKFEDVEDEIRRLDSKESFFKAMHESSNRPAVYFMATNSDLDNKEASEKF